MPIERSHAEPLNHRRTMDLTEIRLSLDANRRAEAGEPMHLFQLRSRENINLNVSLSAPDVTPNPTPVSIFTILLV